MSGAFGKIVRRLSAFAQADEGATIIEYGLIVSLIFLAIMGAVQGFATSTNDMYSDIQSALVN